jgi:dTDP-4-dehydrorhamnose reductase
MRIVLFGKNGQLGWELQRILPILGEVIALARDEVDLSDLHNVQKTLDELKPGLIINTAAYTDVDQAEKESELATKINAAAPGVMAEAARRNGAVFIHYSTDYVFDGESDTPYTENNLPNPLNTYGKSKLMGEENIKQAGDACLILRTSWVYSLRGNSFVNKVLGWARKNETLRIVSDQISNPTWARMLAEITSLMLTQNNANLLEIIRERRGVYHLAGSGYTSRYEWARQILANDPDPTQQLVQTMEPALSEDFPTPAVRPLFSALDCSLFEKTFGLQPPDWANMLKLAMAR